MTGYQPPGMDGVTLTAAMKAAAPQCLVMLMTGYLTPEIERRALAAGADFFVPKPFQLKQIESLVQAALAQERTVGGSGPAALAGAPAQGPGRRARRGRAVCPPCPARLPRPGRHHGGRRLAPVAPERAHTMLRVGCACMRSTARSATRG
jgi:DNA-binding response OmpR family regulator